MAPNVKGSETWGGNATSYFVGGKHSGGEKKKEKLEAIGRHVDLRGRQWGQVLDDST